MNRKLLIFLLLTIPFRCIANSNSVEDSTRNIGFTIYNGPTWVMSLDRYQRKWQKTHFAYAIGGEINYSAVPSDSDAFAADFRYPRISFGAKYSFNHGVKMHKSQDPDWGLAQEVDYDSQLGNSLAIYGRFERAFFRRSKWSTSYSLAMGTAYSHRKYNKENNIDNELIGSRWLIYFAAGLHASYRIAPDWILKGGVEFWHMSNGALNRPNKGANFIGPTLGISYEPFYEETIISNTPAYNPPFEPFFYTDFSIALGAKTLHEDWQQTQFGTPYGEADYRTDKFKRYAAYAFSADIMYRYARRWASGIGFDLFYGTYADHCAEIDETNGLDLKHSPWSFGIAAKHEVFYHNLSLAMAVGGYLYRQMGQNAKDIEQPFYERIGLKYTFPKLGGMHLGINVKAHLTKADYTEIALGYPIRLNWKIKKQK